MSDKIIHATIDEIVEEVIRVSHECNNPNYYKGVDSKLFNEVINSTDEHISIRPSQLRIALEGLVKPDQRDDLLERASWLVGNPGTNISGSTDLACINWQRDYEHFIKSKPTPTEKGGEG